MRQRNREAAGDPQYHAAPHAADEKIKTVSSGSRRDWLHRWIDVTSVKGAAPGMHRQAWQALPCQLLSIALARAAGYHGIHRNLS